MLARTVSTNASTLASHLRWRRLRWKIPTAWSSVTVSMKRANSAGTLLDSCHSIPEWEQICSWCMCIGRITMAKRLSASSVREGLVQMTSEDIKRRKWTKSEMQAMRKASEAQAAGVDLPEKEYEDIPRLTAEQLARMVRFRAVRRKVPVSVRLDPQVLTWLKSKGEGHLTRINDILANLMEAESAAGSRRR